MSADEKKVIDLMAGIESIVGRLYRLYAGRFPERRDFWNDLAREEENHAQLIESLRKYCKKGEITLNEEKCDENIVKTVSGYIKERYRTAKRSSCSLIHALGTALEIEKNIIEKDFCSFFLGDSEEFKKICYVVSRETSQHKEKIRRLMERCRSMQEFAGERA